MICAPPFTATLVQEILGWYTAYAGRPVRVKLSASRNMRLAHLRSLTYPAGHRCLAGNQSSEPGAEAQDPI